MPRRAAGPSDTNGGSKAARTRTRLLDATASLLSRRGFSGTRVAEIAEQADVQAPAIYYHYHSREDLIAEVLFVAASQVRLHLTTALATLPAGSTPTERIAAAVEAHLRHELESSDYAKALIRNANLLPESVSRRALAEVGRYNDIWRELIDELAGSGQLRSDVAPGVGRMIVLGALNWTVEWWDPERGGLDEVIRTTQSMVLHALRP